MLKFRLVIVVGLLLITFIFSQEKKDIVFEDFESGSYGKWKVEGNGFGESPFDLDKYSTFAYTKKNLSKSGKYVGLSFRKGSFDKPVGKLISKPFTIERKNINFLVWGGGSEQVGIRLLIEGKEVAVARGENSKEAFEESFDVSKYIGKKGVLEIFDNSTGGWGHIGVDNIIFSDKSLDCEY